MSLQSIVTNVPGMTGVVPAIIYVQTSDPLATVTASGYVNQYVQREGFNLSANQLAYVSTSDNGNILCQVSISSSGVISLVPVVSGLSQTVSVTGSISSAQILALNATPVTIIPAPGANKIIIPTSAMFALVFGTVQYANGAACQFQWADGSNTNIFSTQVAAATINAAASRSQLLISVVQAANANTFVNQAVQFADTGAAFINGDGTLRYSVSYRIASVA